MAFISDPIQQTKKNSSRACIADRLSMLMRIYCLSLILFGIIGCKSSDIDSEELVPDSVTVLPSDEPVISLGQGVQLSAIVTNSAGMEVSNEFVTWTTSDPNVLAVNSTGFITGLSSGTATVSANAENKTGSLDFHIVDLSGTWVGGEAPDTVSYTLIQTDTIVEGVFQSHLGFPPITDVKEGILTGFLSYARYSHILKLTTENGCELRIMGDHHIKVEEGGELVLIPDSGTLSSSNCSIFGTIDFATLRRQ